MTYGFQTWAANGRSYGNPLNLGAICIGAYTIQPGVSTTLTFPTVPAGSITAFHVALQSHDISYGSSGPYATIIFTPRPYRGGVVGFNPASTVCVFADSTFEPDYGFSAINDLGQRMVSTIHPVPNFVGKVTFGPNASRNYSPPQAGSTGNRIYEFDVNFSIAQGSNRLIMYSLPSSSGTYWFHGPSFIFANSGNALLRLVLMSNVGVGALPEAYVFAIDNLGQSNDGYGFRTWDASGKLLFDAGLAHLSPSQLTKDLAFPSQNSGPYFEYNIPAIAGVSKPLLLIPPYQFESWTRVPNQQAANSIVRDGFVQRQGTIFRTTTLITDTDFEDAPLNTSYTYGAPTGNATFVTDGALYD